ncbi:MAG: alkane 1-monooxygenase [Myxococcota bacterium]
MVSMTSARRWELGGVVRQAGILGAHLLCFSFPLLTTLYLSFGPYTALESLGWLAVVAAMVVVDNHARPSRRQPREQLASWPFDLVLYALVVLQAVNILLLVQRARSVELPSSDAFMMFLMVGINSGYSAIVVAHELIHRPQRHMQFLGRVLLGSVMYEHFFTEHVRGHHARIGTDEDPATARFGETFESFFRRTVPAQFRSAWRLECKRLGEENMPLTDGRNLHNRVLHGLAAEWTFAVLVGVLWGPAALAFFLLQALAAVRLLEAVNYFEHWGLTRRERKVRPVDSWDAESWFTLYSLVGLSRHADHHAYASRPYQQLRHFEESPKLPRGYFGMVVLVLFRNRLCRQLLTDELKRRELGPFAQA